MIKLKLPVIVEGKYDKITLENIIDATIIPTEGFGIFKNKEKCCPLLTTVVSGSPIIQNGKLIGAVTHVFINNPLRGY